jgi:hypothetical protein
VLELLAERWIVGVLRAVLRQGLDREIRSHLQELHDRRRRFGFLTSPGIRGGEVCPGAQNDLPVAVGHSTSGAIVVSWNSNICGPAPVLKRNAGRSKN